MLFDKNRNTQEERRSCHQVPVTSMAVINLLILRNI